MLAHTYMLGPNGQSNGCVSFKDYPKLLEAFLSGEVDRLVVVPDLGDTSGGRTSSSADCCRVTLISPSGARACHGMAIRFTRGAKDDEHQGYAMRPAARCVTAFNRRMPKASRPLARSRPVRLIVWEGGDQAQRYHRPWRGRATASKRPARRLNKPWPPPSKGRSPRRRGRSKYRAYLCPARWGNHRVRNQQGDLRS